MSISESVRTPPRGTSQYRNGNRIQSTLVSSIEFVCVVVVVVVVVVVRILIKGQINLCIPFQCGSGSGRAYWDVTGMGMT